VGLIGVRFVGSWFLLLLLFIDGGIKVSEDSLREQEPWLVSRRLGDCAVFMLAV
jgi:hypothetical protein